MTLRLLLLLLLAASPAKLFTDLFCRIGGQ
jgi:hypothetical protein